MPIGLIPDSDPSTPRFDGVEGSFYGPYEAKESPKRTPWGAGEKFSASFLLSIGMVLGLYSTPTYRLSRSSIYPHTAYSHRAIYDGIELSDERPRAWSQLVSNGGIGSK